MTNRSRTATLPPPHASLADLWTAEKSSSAASFAVQRFEQLRGKLDLLPYRLAILRSFTVEPMVPLLRAAAFVGGIDLTVQLTDFNAYVQQIVDPASMLYQFKADAVLLAVQTRDVAPKLWAGETDNAKEVTASVVADFNSWIRAFRQHSPSHLILHNLELPADSGPAADAVRQINAVLQSLAKEHEGVYILDYASLVGRHLGSWHDERKWNTVRLPIAAGHLLHMVEEWMRFLHPLSGNVAKALVVDLDNTLWGGVIGEDGMAGIRLGNEGAGAVHQELQQALLELHQRGILLAVCSKNNYDDAMHALSHHPGMLLKPSHFAAMRINWGDKPQNLREIAAELNIGLDSLAFLDDNPFERQQVRTQTPEVSVLPVSADASGFAQAVRECPLFVRLSLSQEDLQRGEHYQAQRERAQAEKTLSREDFYRSLEQEIEIAPANAETLPRITQLTNKTNQFNLTTRRYTEQEIAGLMESSDWRCFSLRVRDRFGDNGLVGVAFTQMLEGNCNIETLLMSCRVIGRTVETAFLSFLAEDARKRGASKLTGWFLPTKKNAPARDFYPLHGFRKLVTHGKGGELWEFDLNNGPIACPEWVKLTVKAKERDAE